MKTKEVLFLYHLKKLPLLFLNRKVEQFMQLRFLQIETEVGGKEVD